MPEGTSVTQAAPSLERQSTTRVAVYTDHLFWRQDGELYSDRSFPGFVARLAPLVGSLVFLARVDPAPGAAQHKLPAGTEVVEMPWVGSLSNPLDVVRMMAGSVRRFWRVLDRVDAVWLVGSYLISFVFAAIAAARGKRVVLGVRQDLPEYARGRYPGRRWIHLVADALEGVYRLLARVFPIVVVGPGLARNFRRARSLLQLSVSLVSEDDIVSREQALARPYDGELTILSVGRLDPEKNPLLLADVLAQLNTNGRQWRMVICGDGPLEGALAERLAELGLGDRADLRGYVALEGRPPGALPREQRVPARLVDGGPATGAVRSVRLGTADGGHGRGRGARRRRRRGLAGPTRRRRRRCRGARARRHARRSFAKR